MESCRRIILLFTAIVNESKVAYYNFIKLLSTGCIRFPRVFDNVPRSLFARIIFRFVMQVRKETCPWPRVPASTHASAISTRDMKAISHPAECVIIAPCATEPRLFLFFFPPLLFFSRSPSGVLARSRFPIPPLPCLSFSRIRHRITRYADTNHYYSQDRTSRRTDICKSRVIQ